jgi:hypothetical protein
MQIVTRLVVYIWNVAFVGSGFSSWTFFDRLKNTRSLLNLNGILNMYRKYSQPKIKLSYGATRICKIFSDFQVHYGYLVQKLHPKTRINQIIRLTKIQTENHDFFDWLTKILRLKSNFGFFVGQSNKTWFWVWILVPVLFSIEIKSANVGFHIVWFTTWISLHVRQFSLFYLRLFRRFKLQLSNETSKTRINQNQETNMSSWEDRVLTV